MSEQNKPFVITDRRKFTLDGEIRPDAEIQHEESVSEPATPEPVATAPGPSPESGPQPVSAEPEAEAEQREQEQEIPAIPEEQMEQARRAYEATAERLDTAIRATNPGMERLPEMSFTGVVQSVYMTALMQMGGGAPEGQPAQVDLMGARQSIDMLAVLAEKTKGNLTTDESRLLDNALFELRMGFLEVTQALARSAAAKSRDGGIPGAPGGPAGPRIVR